VQRDADDIDAYSDVDFPKLINGGLAWLADHQNDDGGWGDTVKSLSNISTTMLAHAVFHATESTERYSAQVQKAKEYIDDVGGVQAVIERYGKDKTFSIPILTHCALAGLIEWDEITALPFELACLPANFYKTVKLPVVSYALPALIAIGNVRFQKKKTWNPILRFIRSLAVKPSLRVLERIQPGNGGFLEATPLTSFVTMSLAGMGRADHAVAMRGIDFIVQSVQADGSWPIDTNLATWVTTLSVNALQEDLPVEAREPIRDWLLEQQYREVHPYTNADPGGWAWTDLPGGVPDADDTPGAMLALMNLGDEQLQDSISEQEQESLEAGVVWLLGLQNRNGGWPTFCRGWGTLPFDRSSADITAHVLRALGRWVKTCADQSSNRSLKNKVLTAIDSGFQFLRTVQQADGSWFPLWFGNQFADDDENPTYGSAKVLAAYRDSGNWDCPEARSALKWLNTSQNDDGGWGGGLNVASSVEETALAVEILLSDDDSAEAAEQGLTWLIQRIEDGSFEETTPIGFYFAKLWYFERLYPLIFVVSALRRACRLAVENHAEESAALYQQSREPAVLD